MHSFRGLIAFSPEQFTLSNAGGFRSQRASAAGSVMGRLGLLAPGAGNAEFASVFVVSENYFQVLRVAPTRGRGFESMSAAELTASPSVLISENYWEKRFANEPVLGKSVRLNGVAFTIAGITPRDFVGTGAAAPDFWMPISLEPLAHGDERWLQDRENPRYRMFGRLGDGVSIRQARAEMNLVSDRVRTLHDAQSESAKRASVLVWPGSPFPLPLNLYPGLNLTIALVLIAAGMVLIVACANAGSLQLARARSRENEMRTRQSLGADRSRIVRQLLTESALVGLLAGATALFFSWALLRVAVTFIPEAVPAEYGTLIFNVNPDFAIFAYVFGISLAAGILFGLAPAFESSRSALWSATRSGTATMSGRRLQDFLLAAQVALSVVLMVAGSMLIRGAIGTLKTDTGYDSQHVIDLAVQFPENARYTAARKLGLIRELRARLAAMPGIAAVSSARPPAENGFRTAAATQGTQSLIHYNHVERNYFDTLGIPLTANAGFGLNERTVIVSESTAKQFWPNQNPVGLSLRLGATDERWHGPAEMLADGPSYVVAGVARDTRGVEFNGSDSKRIYLPLAQDRISGWPILIRTRTDASQVIREIDSVVSSVDPDLVVTSSTLEAMLRRTAPFVVSSLAAAFASVVGLLGLLLASMGIYGTVSYIVVLRTREVGIRMAIGAQKRDVLQLILAESAQPVLAGLLVGLFLAVGVSSLLRRWLYGLNGIDSVSFAAVSLLLLTIALLASYPPARRALHVDPMVALRYE